MNAERRPDDESEAAPEELATQPFESIVPQYVSTPGVSSPLIGATVEKQLDGTLWRLVLGEVGLQDLTPALAGFYLVGHADGVASQAGLLAQARHDAARYYARAFGDPALIKRVLERMEAEFIRTVEADMLGGGR